MASVTAWLNDKYKKQDGTCAVYVVTYVHRQKVKFNTGVSVTPEQWNYERNRVKGSSKKTKDDNLVIDKCIARVHDVFVRYRLQARELTPELLRDEYKIPSTYVDFYEFWERKMNDQRGVLAVNTIKQHQSVLNKLKEYRKQLMFSQITQKFLEDYDKYMKNKEKRSPNTRKKKLNIIKGYLTIAVKEGIINDHPFQNIKLKGADSDIVFLTEEELKKLWDLYRADRFPENQKKVLQPFLFSCFTSLRKGDCKRITHDDIIADKIILKPEKQKGKLIRIPINDYAKQIMKDVGKHKITGPIFEFYSDKVTRVLLAKAIDGAGIDKPITFHCARHTFATYFLKKTKNLAVLQKIMGHTNISDTLKYAHVLGEDIDKEMLNAWADF